MIRVALYIRVSSDRQVKIGDSLREQQDTLEEYVKTRKDMIIHSTYIDDGISGRKIKRDEFTRLIDDVKSGLVDLILFTKLDRWFRSLKHYLNVQDILDKYNVHWTAVSQPYYDTTTAYGRTFINQVMSFAELEAEMTSERVHSVNANKVKMGEVISGSTPLGYSIVNKHLVPNEQAPIAQAVFEFYDKTGNLNQTADYLFNHFAISRTSKAIREMLKNTKYIGVFRNNENYNDPIISADLFESVNRQLGMNTKSSVKHSYLFNGLLYCGNCGKKLNSKRRSFKSRPRKDGTRKSYPHTTMYVCRYAYQHPKCINTKSLREHLLEEYLLDNLPTWLAERVSQVATVKQERDLTSQKKAALEKKIERLKTAYLNEIIGIDEYKQDREKLVQELVSLDLDKKPDNKIDVYNDLIKMDIKKFYPDLDRIEKKQFWRSIIKRITFDNDRQIEVELL